jgi:hypothetical protein
MINYYEQIFVRETKTIHLTPEGFQMKHEHVLAIKHTSYTRNTDNST